MADGCKAPIHYESIRRLQSLMIPLVGTVNQARAVRVAELMNDYRTLLLHISQQQADASPEEYYEDGFTVLRECHAAAQRLLSANYQPCPVTGTGNAETEKAELQRYAAALSPQLHIQQFARYMTRTHPKVGFRVIIDSCTRRFQAHKIYLRAAAARRWAMTRMQTLRGQRPTSAHGPALKAAQVTLQQELARVTDQHVVSDLRAADLRAGHWLDDDPSLDMMQRWSQGR